MDAINSLRISRKILLIDDRLDAIMPIRVLLSRDGHVIFEAGTGEDGVATAIDVQPDVVLCDIGLPGRWDGYDVIRQLRSRQETKTAYMIAVSGYCQAEDVERSQQAGFDEHFAKPVDIGKLRRLMARELLKSDFVLGDVLPANSTRHQADHKQYNE